MKRLTSFLILLIAALGCSDSSRKNISADAKNECIAGIMAVDDSLGKIRNHACERISMSQTITQYADAMEKFDFRNCPVEYAIAYEKHRKAWIDILAVTDKYPDLRGEMHVLFKQLEQSKDSDEFKPLLKSVWDTWAEVETAMKD